MRWEEIPWDPPPRTLRQFALLCLVAFGGLAAWEGLSRGRVGPALALAALAATIGPLGLWRPRWVRPVFVTWMVLAFPIGWVVSQVLLGLVYFGVVTPVGLGLRLFGHDPLSRRRDPRAETYWAARTPPADRHRYFRQY